MRRAEPRTHLRTGGLACALRRAYALQLALMAAVTLGLAVPARADEVASLFASQAGTPRLPSAAQMVETALDNLFAPESMMRIETVRTDSEGEVSQARFLVMRRVVDGNMRILTESLEPASIAGTRVLQVETDSGGELTYAFIRTLGREPFETTFRLADPFLCTWFEKEEGAEAPGFDFGARHEVLARRPDSIAGEPVQRITVRPNVTRGYDRIELAIAEKDFVILEYRHFVQSSDSVPSLIARADRKDMVEQDGRILPTVLRYEDLALQSVTFATIQHGQLPAGTPNILFEPRSFHRARTDQLPANLEQ